MPSSRARSTSRAIRSWPLSGLAAVAEEEVADVVDGQQVVGLGDAVGVALEDGADVGGDVAGERVDDAARD